MKLFQAICVGFIIVMVATSCNEVEEKGSTVVADQVQDSVIVSQEEMNQKSQELISKLMTPEDFNLQLNNGEKWELSGEPLKKILQLKQQVYVISGNMENYEVPSYNMLGDEILEFLNTIPVLENEEVNTEYQKVIKETKNQCVFLMGSNKQEAQVAVINLSILYDEIPKYFVSAEK
ncbi:MAG: hypothetical protein ACPGRC_02800 [Salibacteraceae bacterium]